MQSDVAERLNYGSENENHAVATLVGYFFTVYFSGMPPVSIGKTVAAIEIKCPFPSENKMPVHYSLPPYYVCQCLAEMVVLEINTLIYVFYSKQSTTCFNVQFDSELWDMLMVEITHLYDQPHPLTPPKNETSCTGPEEKNFRILLQQRHLFM